VLAKNQNAINLDTVNEQKTTADSSGLKQAEKTTAHTVLAKNQNAINLDTVNEQKTTADSSGQKHAEKTTTHTTVQAKNENAKNIDTVNEQKTTAESSDLKQAEKTTAHTTVQAKNQNAINFDTVNEQRTTADSSGLKQTEKTTAHTAQAKNQNVENLDSAKGQKTETEHSVLNRAKKAVTQTTHVKNENPANLDVANKSKPLTEPVLRDEPHKVTQVNPKAEKSVSNNLNVDSIKAGRANAESPKISAEINATALNTKQVQAKQTAPHEQERVSEKKENIKQEPLAVKSEYTSSSEHIVTIDKLDEYISQISESVLDKTPVAAQTALDSSKANTISMKKLVPSRRDKETVLSDSHRILSIRDSHVIVQRNKVDSNSKIDPATIGKTDADIIERISDDYSSEILNKTTSTIEPELKTAHLPQNGEKQNVSRTAQEPATGRNLNTFKMDKNSAEMENVQAAPKSQPINEGIHTKPNLTWEDISNEKVEIIESTIDEPLLDVQRQKSTQTKLGKNVGEQAAIKDTMNNDSPIAQIEENKVEKQTGKKSTVQNKTSKAEENGQYNQKVYSQEGQYGTNDNASSNNGSQQQNQTLNHNTGEDFTQKVSSDAKDLNLNSTSSSSQDVNFTGQQSIETKTDISVSKGDAMLNNLPRYEQIRESVLDMLKTVEHSGQKNLHVKIKIEELGQISIRLKKDMEYLSVMIQTSSMKSKEAVEKLLPQLQNSLQVEHNNLEMNVTYDDRKKETFDRNMAKNRNNSVFSDKEGVDEANAVEETVPVTAKRTYEWSSYEAVA
jgi:flagellar hook-length control protein FliK